MTIWLPSFAALLILFVALVATGRALRSPIMLRPFIGLCLAIAIGGVANATHLYSVTGSIVLAGLAVASLLFIKTGATAPVAIDRPMLAAWIVLAALLSVVPPPILVPDDASYLVFMSKLAQLGGTGPEPYSMRRMFTFGGHFPLSAAFLQLFGLRGLAMVDPGLGLLLIGWLVAAAPVDPARRRIAGGLAMTFLTYSFFFGAHPSVNTMPGMLAMAVVAAICTTAMPWVARNGRDLPALPLVSLAVLAVVAISIRPLPLPFLAMLFVALRGSILRTPRAAALAVIAALLVLLPMMIAMRESSSTLFYPFLGLGTSVPGMGTIRADGVWNLPDHSAVAMLPIVAGVALIALSSATRRRPQVILLACSVLFMGLIAVIAPERDFARYTFTVTGAVVIAQALHADLERLFAGRSARAAAALPHAVPAGVAMLLLIGVLAPLPAGAPLRKRFAGLSVGRGDSASCRALQSKTPPGSTILAFNTDCAFTMDFERNTILVHDMPGAAMPPSSRRAGPASFGQMLARGGIGYVLSPHPTFFGGGHGPNVLRLSAAITRSAERHPPLVAGTVELRPQAAFQ